MAPITHGNLHACGVQQSINEHEAIVQAIIDNQPEQGEAAMKSHLQKVKEELLQLMKTFQYPIQ